MPIYFLRFYYKVICEAVSLIFKFVQVSFSRALLNIYDITDEILDVIYQVFKM